MLDALGGHRQERPEWHLVYTVNGAKTEHLGYVTRYLLGDDAQAILERFPAFASTCCSRAGPPRAPTGSCVAAAVPQGRKNLPHRLLAQAAPRMLRGEGTTTKQFAPPAPGASPHR